MPRVDNVERRIAQVERFYVRFRGAHGADIRGDRQIAASYNYERRAADTSTVRTWKQTRFARAFPGFDVDVLDADGRAVHGGTLLRTVRDTYDRLDAGRFC